jgi:hypothetical protein
VVKVTAQDLMLTPAVREMNGGSFAYFGIENNLRAKNCYFFDPSVDTIELTFNTDGVNLTNSSSSTFWPILGKCSRANVFLIALFHGNSKPNDFNSFMTDFVDEANKLTKNGIIILGRKYFFRVKNFTADTPAKAGVLCCKYPTGYSSCTKCTVRGVRKLKAIPNDNRTDSEHSVKNKKSVRKICTSKKSSDITNVKSNIHFLDVDEPLRKHSDYNSFTINNEFHHKRPKIADLENFDLVDDVVTDGMHAEGGLVKRILLALLEGSKCFLRNDKRRKRVLGEVSTSLISSRLTNLQKYCPTEFARKPRSLEYIRQYKTTEFRQILLYTGVVILKKYLPEKNFENFATLCVIMRILNSDDIKPSNVMCTYVEDLIKCFLTDVAKLYGDPFVTHTVHILLHLPRDWLRFGAPVHTFSCYSFENFNFHLVNNIRSGNKPVHQMINRYNENIKAGIYEEKKNKKLYCRKNGFRTDNFEFRIDREADQYCSIGCGDGMQLIKLKSINFEEDHQQEDNMVIIGRRFRLTMPFFSFPCDSRKVNIYQCDPVSTLNKQLIKFRAADISGKFYPIPLSDRKLILVKLLHVF